MINPPVAVALLGLREQLGLRGMATVGLDLVEAELRRLSAVEDDAALAGPSWSGVELPHTGDGV